MNSATCWLCDRRFDYDGEKYRDVICEYCGVLNSIYNPDKPDWKPDNNTTGEQWINGGEEGMGILKDRAREKSPFITLEIGEETPMLIYKSWKETQDRWNNDTFRYIFELETSKGAISKQLDNRSQQFAEAMDEIPFGAKVIIAREPKKDDDGNVIPDKSIWTVRKVE
jgi:hypothetical protein